MSDEAKLDLAAIKAKCAAATPGPWKASGGRGAASVRSEWANCAIYINVRQNGETPECVNRWHRDAEFIAAARTDVPALVAEVERLREWKETHSVSSTLRTRAETAEAEVARLTAQKDNAYNERDRCVSVIACLARALGWPVWLGTHEVDPWDEEWRNIVFVETPHGQVSWHYHDSERPMFSWIGLGMPTPKPWDGHSTPEKYNLLFGLVHDGIPNVQAEVARLREERDDQASLVEVFEDEAKRLRSDLASCYRLTGADPDGDDDAMLARKAVNAVRRLREESDKEAETADKRIAELEAIVALSLEALRCTDARDAAYATYDARRKGLRYYQDDPAFECTYDDRTKDWMETADYVAARDRASVAIDARDAALRALLAKGGAA